MTRSAIPLTQVLNAYGISRIQLAATAGVDLKTIGKLCRGEFLSVKIGTLYKVAAAVGVAPADIVPALALRHRVPDRRARTEEPRGSRKPQT